MKKVLCLICVLCLVLLAGCSKPTIDTSSTETEIIVETSDKKVKAEKIEPEATDFNESEISSDSSLPETESEIQSETNLSQGVSSGDTTDEISSEEQPQYISTIVAPKEVYLYKDGVKYRFTEPEKECWQMLKNLESRFEVGEPIARAKSYVKKEEFDNIKANGNAIEFFFDEPPKLYGGVFSDNARSLFIPLSGSYDFCIFVNIENVTDGYGGPMHAIIPDIASLIEIAQKEVCVS